MAILFLFPSPQLDVTSGFPVNLQHKGVCAQTRAEEGMNTEMGDRETAKIHIHCECGESSVNHLLTEAVSPLSPYYPALYYCVSYIYLIYRVLYATATTKIMTFKSLICSGIHPN